MAENDVEVKFGASTDAFNASMQKAAEQLTGATKTMQGGLEGLGEAFAAVKGPLLLLTAVLGALEGFHHAIEETIKLNTEALGLSRTLGITGEAAGTLNTLLGDVGSSSEAYTGAFLKFNRALRTQSQEMGELGVNIKGIKDGTVDSSVAFVQALQIVGQYRAGIDQTQIAMKLFGRSVEEVQKLQKLTQTVTADAAKALGKSREELNATLSPMEKYNANLEGAAEKNRELNLTITSEGLTATREYKEAINDVKDVWDGVSKTVGETVMPMLTNLANGFAEIGPYIVRAVQAVMEVFGALTDVLGQVFGLIGSLFAGPGESNADAYKGFIEDLTSAFEDLCNGIKEVFSGVSFLIDTVKALAVSLDSADAETEKTTSSMDAFAQVGKFIGDIFRFVASVIQNVVFVLKVLGIEIAGIAARINALAHGDFKGFSAISKMVKEDVDRAKKELDDFDDKLAKSISRGSKSAVPVKTPAGNPVGGAKQAPIGAVPKDQMAGLEAELAAKKAEITRKAFVEEGKFREMTKAEEQKFWQVRLSKAGLNGNERLKIQQKIGALEIESIKDTQQKKLQALQEEEQHFAHNFDKKRALVRQEMTLYDKNTSEYAAAHKKLAKIDEEELQQQKRIAEEKEQLKLRVALAGVEAEKQAADQRLALGLTTDQQRLEQEKAFEQKMYDLKSQDLQRQIDIAQQDPDKNLELIQQLNDKKIEEELRFQQKVAEIRNKVELESSKPVLGMIKSIQGSFQQSIAGMLSGTMTLAQGVKGIWQGIKNAVIQNIAEMLAKFIAGKAIESALGKKSAMNGAYEMAVNAYKSASQIPYVGWILGPIAGAAALAAGLAWGGSISSAAGGYDIPSGINPMTQLHEKEMVLPAHLAEPLRQNLSEGGGAGGKGVTVHINAVDSRSVHHALMEGGALHKALKDLNRNFAR